MSAAVKMQVELHVAPSQKGWGIRMKLKGANCPPVWLGQGWSGPDQVPEGATATIHWGFQWVTTEQAEQHLAVLAMEQEGYFVAVSA